ncbi:MAG: 3'(2'), 5'-bisphosphate nucleotidase [Candidatus Endobugula sp.]|jgi:3'(2'), 5'-bisphosphate nucleotidase
MYADLIQPLLALTQQASLVIMDVYAGHVAINESVKDDNSPVTAADIAANTILTRGLSGLLADTPVLSEEDIMPTFEVRRRWVRYWLIDPLDGTKEFLAKNDEFTVNIALIENGYPVLGIVTLPVSGVSYYGICSGAGQGAYRIEKNQSPILLGVREAGDGSCLASPLIVLMSRRHNNLDTDTLVNFLNSSWPFVRYLQVGSSLKFCRIAEAIADFYPRLAPTCVWDTGAAQAIVEAAGGHVVDTRFRRLSYNAKESLVNPNFYVIGSNLNAWQERLAVFSP